jgi:hypothetical protein
VTLSKNKLDRWPCSLFRRTSSWPSALRESLTMSHHRFLSWYEATVPETKGFPEAKFSFKSVRCSTRAWCKFLMLGARSWVVSSLMLRVNVARNGVMKQAWRSRTVDSSLRRDRRIPSIVCFRCHGEASPFTFFSEAATLLAESVFEGRACLSSFCYAFAG